MSLIRSITTIRMVVTLRCIFRCPYCTMPKREVPEIHASDWMKILEKIPYEQANITGGEPMLHRNIIEIINRLTEQRKNVCLFTNVCAWQPIHFARIKPDPKLYVSVSVNPDTNPIDFESKFAALVAMGIVGNVHYVDSPLWYPDIEPFCEIVEQQGLKLEPVKDQQAYTVQKHGTWCFLPRIIIGPDGRRYPCGTLIGEPNQDIFFDDDDRTYIGRDCDRTDCCACDRYTMAGEKHVD